MTVAVPGAELFYATRGRGPACIVLSSIGTGPYERMMPAHLDAHLQLVFVDPRSAGRSSGKASDLTFDVLANDLDAIRRAIGVSTIAVMGHSILGALAIEYARRRPETVSHVITVGLPPSGDMSALAARAAALFEAEASAERKSVLNDNLARLPADATAGQALFARTPMRFFDPCFDAAPLFAGSVMQPAFFQHLFGTLTPGWDAVAALADLDTPVWLAQGRFDYASPPALWDGLLSSLPLVTRHIFEHSGHQPFVEEPERFATALVAWMVTSHGVEGVQPLKPRSIQRLTLRRQ